LFEYEKSFHFTSTENEYSLLQLPDENFFHVQTEDSKTRGGISVLAYKISKDEYNSHYFGIPRTFVRSWRFLPSLLLLSAGISLGLNTGLKHISLADKLSKWLKLGVSTILGALPSLILGWKCYNIFPKKTAADKKFSYCLGAPYYFGHDKYKRETMDYVRDAAINCLLEKDPDV